MPNCDFGKPCCCSDCANFIKKTQTCLDCNNDIYKVIDYYGLCEHHYSIYIHNKNTDEKIRLDYENVGENKYNEFLKNIKFVDVELVPIKYIKTKKYKENKYNSKYLINKELFNISKINNRWVINKKAVELFLDMGLDEYYCLKV